MFNSTIYAGLSYNNKQHTKNNTVYELLNHLHELNSSLGLIQSHLLKCNIDEFYDIISQIRHTLLNIEKYIASSKVIIKSRITINKPHTDISFNINKYKENLSRVFENTLDAINEPIYAIYTCKLIYLKTQYSIVCLNSSVINNNILKFINELSDFLDSLTNYVNYKVNYTKYTQTI